MISRWNGTTAGLDAALDDADPWAVTIVVHQEAGTHHEDALLAAARGIALLLDDERWDEEKSAWNARRIRKVVRRAKGKRWEDARSLEGVDSVHGSAAVRIFPPNQVTLTPPLLGRLQVSGLDLPRLPQPPHVDYEGTVLSLALNPLVSMTTGKACAQVGHVAHLAALTGDEHALGEWADAGFPVRLRAWGDDADVQVQDAGFTEVPPGTVTARGWWERG